jgi:hypothetical protein
MLRFSKAAISKNPGHNMAAFLQPNNTVGQNMKRCTPVRFVRENPTLRGRIGGRPPLGIAPRHKTEDTAYFATVPLSESLDVSVFLSATWDTNPKTSIWHWSRRLLDNRTGIVEAIPHAPLLRARRTTFWELLAACSLQESPARLDIDPDWEGCAYLDHKFGGEAGFTPENGHLEQEVRRISADGFFQVAQFAFPSAADESIEGSWPFGEMTFHLFAHLGSTVPDFRFLWSK